MEMQSPTIGALAKALAAAQAELSPATKNAKNPHLKNRYADITAVYEAIRSVLPHHGLAVVQTMIPHDGHVACVRTTLMHESGEWIAGEIAMPLPTMGNNAPQQMGSAITYARRYSLSAIVGVVSEDDDDAEGASPRQIQQARQQARAGNPNPMTADQQKALMAHLTRKYGANNRAAYLAEMSNYVGRQLGSCNDLTKDEVSSYLDIAMNNSEAA